MSQESSSNKTEQPTPKRLRDARKKGQVAVSKEVTATFVIVATVLYFFVLFDDMVGWMQSMMVAPGKYMDLPFKQAMIELGMEVLYYAGIITITFVGGMFFAAVAGVLIQIGWLWAPEKIKLNPNAINPINGAKNLFSKKNLFETFKAIIKILVYGFVAWFIIYINIDGMIRLYQCDVECQLAGLSLLMLQMFGFICIALLFLSVLDYLMQNSLHIKEMMMTKDEVKREFKDVEGNPEVKQKRKEVHREILEGSNGRVGASTAVVTNPTHVAVGIYYEQDKTPLPIVVFMATDDKAQSLKQEARRMNKPIIEDVALARGLLDAAQIDHYVPDQYLDAVARTLRWAKQISGR